MRATRTTQPYRAGAGVRAPTQVLLAMLRGAGATGNPMDAQRGLAKMATRAGARRTTRALPPLRTLPPRRK